MCFGKKTFLCENVVCYELYCAKFKVLKFKHQRYTISNSFVSVPDRKGGNKSLLPQFSFPELKKFVAKLSSLNVLR